MFLLNVLSSVAIIFVNKKLMSQAGYGFGFGKLHLGSALWPVSPDICWRLATTLHT